MVKLVQKKYLFLQWNDENLKHIILKEKNV